jgi:hypothetical protein
MFKVGDIVNVKTEALQSYNKDFLKSNVWKVYFIGRKINGKRTLLLTNIANERDFIRFFEEDVEISDDLL